MPYGWTRAQQAARASRPRWISRAGERAHWADPSGRWLGTTPDVIPAKPQAPSGGGGWHQVGPRFVEEHMLHRGGPGLLSSYDMRERAHWADPSGRWVAPPPSRPIGGGPGGGNYVLPHETPGLPLDYGHPLGPTPASPPLAPQNLPAEFGDPEREALVRYYANQMRAAERAASRGRRTRRRR